MALKPNKSLYKPGDFVLYDREYQAMVDSIEQTLFGCNTYMITLLNDGQAIKATSLELEHSSLAEDFDEMDMPDNPDIVFVDDEEEANTSSETNKRFAKLSEQEVSDLADRRLAKSTKKTTNWGVKIFKGRLCPYIFTNI